MVETDDGYNCYVYIYLRIHLKGFPFSIIFSINLFNIKHTFNSKFLNNKSALSHYTKENSNFIKYSLYFLFVGFSLFIVFIDYSVNRMFIHEVLCYTGLFFSFMYVYMYFLNQNVKYAYIYYHKLENDPIKSLL